MLYFDDKKFQRITSEIYDVYVEVSANYDRKSLDEHVNGAFIGEGMEADDYTMVRLHSIVRCILADGRTYEEVKKDLLYVMNRITMRYINTNKQLSVAEKRFKDFLNRKIEALREKQKSENALETSVITGCAIIAPYVGKLVKPSPTIINQNMSAVNLKGRAGEELNEMFHNPDILDKVIPYSSILTDIGGPERVHDVISMLAESRRINAEMNIAVIYFAWAYIYKNALFLPLKDMNLYLENVEAIADISMSALMESYMELLPADEASLLSHLEDYDKLSKFMSSPVETKQAMADAVNAAKPPFDLQPLMNYIFMARRYYANDYTNKAFMSSKSVAGYATYKDYLIIYPRKSDDLLELDYIYVPVVDMLADRHVVIIKYHRSGEIEVLSEAEYQKETENQ